MSDDIAALGLKVDSSGVTTAADALNRLNTAAGASSAAAQRLAQSASPASSAYDQLAKSVSTAVSAHKSHGQAMQNSSIAALEFAHVARSLTEQISAGVNPLRALTVEFGRITTLLQYGGGLGGIFDLAKNKLTEFLTPARAAAGVLVGLGAAGVAAFAGWESRLGALQTALNGVGRSTGLTLGALNRAAVGAAGGGTSISQAQDAFATLTSTGHLSPGLMAGLVSGGRQSVISQYANATGSSYADATKGLAADFADPTKGADALNKQFGFLNDSTRQLVMNLEASGRSAEAQGVLLTSLKQGLSGATDQTWGFARAWAAVTGAISGASSAVGSTLQSILDPSLEQRYATAVRRYGQTSGAPGRSLAGGGPLTASQRIGLAGLQGQNSASQADLEDLNEQLRRRGQAASQLGQATIADQRSQAAGELVRQVVSDLSSRQTLVNDRDRLSNALGTPGARSGLDPDTAKAADEALARLNARIENFATTAQRVAQDSTYAAQAIQAQTAQERTAIDALKAFNDVMRDSGDKALAAATATAKWSEAIAASNKAADDALRNANDRAGMIGLSPFGRGYREIENRYRDMGREAVTGPVSSLGGYGGFTALDDRTTPLALAMSRSSGASGILDLDAAGKLTSFGGKRTDRVVPTVRTSPEYPDHFSVPLGSMAYDYGGGSSDVTVTGGRRVGRYAPAASAYAPGNINVPVASTSGATRGSAQGVDIGAYMDERTSEVIRQANEELTRNKALLDARSNTLGMDTAAMNKAVAAQEMWNKLQLSDNDQKLLGTTRMAALTRQISGYSTTVAAQQQQQIDLQNRVDAVNTVRDMGSQFVSGAANDIFSSWNTDPRSLVGQLNQGDQMNYYAGKMSGNQVRDKIRQRQISQLFSSILEKQGVSMIESGLFGKGSFGSSNYQPGLLGGLFSGLFGMTGSGSSQGASGGVFGGLLGGLGNLFGGGGGGGGSSGGSASGLASLFSGGFGGFFADGGIMTGQGPVPLRRYAGGGVANSPQAAIFGEGSRPEAYVPLPDGRSIPVAMKGGGRGGAPAIQVNQAGHTIVVQGNADDKAISQMRSELAAAMKQQQTDLQRNIGGQLAKWNQRYG